MVERDRRFGPFRRFVGRAMFVVLQAADVGNEPHYVRAYRRLVRRLKADYPRDEAMSFAVGGGYRETGERLADAVAWAGLEAGHSLLDLGCGSGTPVFGARPARRDLVLRHRHHSGAARSRPPQRPVAL